MPCEEALNAFARALLAYIKVNAGRAVAIASLTGQRRIRVSLRALRRFYKPLGRYALFDEAFSELLRDPLWLKRLGWELETINGETYITMPLITLKNLLNIREVETLVTVFKRAGACSDI